MESECVTGSTESHAEARKKSVNAILEVLESEGCGAVGAGCASSQLILFSRARISARNSSMSPPKNAILVQTPHRAGARLFFGDT